MDLKVPWRVKIDPPEEGEHVLLVCFLRVWWSTSPVPTFNAANKSVVPLRL
jgi:hypothetical protein